MSIAYFDCFCGASGDMILGALIDAGMPLAHLTRELALVKIGKYRVEARRAKGMGGTDLRVTVKSAHGHPTYREIDRLISRSRLARGVRDCSRAIFLRLAEAEARVHRIAVGRVHFHEVGAVDSLVDVIGAAIGLNYFGFKGVYSSPLPMSRGSVTCEHGTLPVPAPATLELLKGIPLEKSDVLGEIVTPTGAAILTTVAERFGECPIQQIGRVGIGIGDRCVEGRPNILRLMVGDGFPAVVIEADIDDMNPQIFERAMELVFAAGAMDVSLSAIQMKKNRPGIRLSCIAPWDAKDCVIDTILEETTTFGVRYWPVERRMLTRELTEAKVRRSGISFKIGRDSSGRVVKAMPEFEDVKKLARKTGRPLIQVYNECLAAAFKLVKK